MSEMIEVTIDSVRVSLMSPQRVIVLRERDADHYLPIWVGPYEAESITVALQEIEMIRPLTHDLLKNVFATFKANILRVEIISLREDIFFGNIIVEKDGKIVKIDSRPSDAIAIAVRAHVPIWVDPAVMKNAGIQPEDDIQNADTSSTASPKDDESLSIFEDFFDQLEEDDNKSDENPESDPENET